MLLYNSRTTDCVGSCRSSCNASTHPPSFAAVRAKFVEKGSTAYHVYEFTLRIIGGGRRVDEVELGRASVLMQSRTGA
jgi:hypothetical protein